ncbi:E3 ubiquitin-protein ligase Rnf220-like [Atheta coriaria]|uniref:E3 ubiquitin-protein ligase Rnf220-like n=1 Tax=Dalotia coriaria TaxID=877792 RepID=UPI0031F40F86
MEQSVHETPSTSGAVFDDFARACRRQKRQIDPATCPVCSCTLRANEADQHLHCEIEKLQKINVRSKLNGKSNHTTSTSPTHSLNGEDNENGVDKLWETYQKVRTNRQCRQKSKAKKRKTDEVICPVCNKETTEEINLHVEQCLRKNGHTSEESDENIDVENFEEYEWAGQSRVRATTLLQGGVTSLGTSVTMADEDEDLVVDGDDAQMFGSPQYSERDIILPDADKARDALRKAVLGADGTGDEPDEDDEDNELTCEAQGDPTIEALKNRIRELESRESNNAEVYKCLICMERYKKPVISVCCWHVHCEICWLQTLGAKKLCPQCNMITSPADLRRIYM